jgi:hypothetical protein
MIISLFFIYSRREPTRSKTWATQRPIASRQDGDAQRRSLSKIGSILEIIPRKVLAHTQPQEETQMDGAAHRGRLSVSSGRGTVSDESPIEIRKK